MNTLPRGTVLVPFFGELAGGKDLQNVNAIELSFATCKDFRSFNDDGIRQLITLAAWKLIDCISQG